MTVAIPELIDVGLAFEASGNWSVLSLFSRWSCLINQSSVALDVCWILTGWNCRVKTSAIATRLVNVYWSTYANHHKSISRIYCIYIYNKYNNIYIYILYTQYTVLHNSNGVPFLWESAHMISYHNLVDCSSMYSSSFEFLMICSHNFCQGLNVTALHHCVTQAAGLGFVTLLPSDWKIFQGSLGERRSSLLALRGWSQWTINFWEMCWMFLDLFSFGETCVFSLFVGEKPNGCAQNEELPWSRGSFKRSMWRGPIQGSGQPCKQFPEMNINLWWPHVFQISGQLVCPATPGAATCWLLMACPPSLPPWMRRWVVCCWLLFYIGHFQL